MVSEWCLRGCGDNCYVKGGTFLLTCQCSVRSPRRMLLVLLGKVIYLILPMCVSNFSQSSASQNNSLQGTVIKQGHTTEDDSYSKEITPFYMGFYALKTFINSLSWNSSDGSISYKDWCYMALVTVMPSELVSSRETPDINPRSARGLNGTKNGPNMHIQVFPSHLLNSDFMVFTGCC